MIGPPEAHEFAPSYLTYISKVSTSDIVSLLDAQLQETLALFSSIGEEKSLHRYAPGKWTIRQALNHVNDTERVFLFRALWFARSLDTPLPSFDQDIAAAAAGADDCSWATLIEEFRLIRMATLAFFRHLPADAWMRSGVANGYSFTTRALAYIIAGHTWRTITRSCASAICRESNAFNAEPPRRRGRQERGRQEKGVR